MKYVSRNIAQMKEEVRRHIEADAVVQGHYWKEANNDAGGCGCFLGCLTHIAIVGRNSSRVRFIILTERFGLSKQFAGIAEHLFERSDSTDAVEFFRDIPDAIDVDGKDLSDVHWQFANAIFEGSRFEKDELFRDVYSHHLKKMKEHGDFPAFSIGLREWEGSDDIGAEIKRQRDIFLDLIRNAPMYKEAQS